MVSAHDDFIIIDRVVVGRFDSFSLNVQVRACVSYKVPRECMYDLIIEIEVYILQNEPQQEEERFAFGCVVSVAEQ